MRWLPDWPTELWNSFTADDFQNQNNLIITLILIIGENGVDARAFMCSYVCVCLREPRFKFMKIITAIFCNCSNCKATVILITPNYFEHYHFYKLACVMVRMYMVFAHLVPWSLKGFFHFAVCTAVRNAWCVFWTRNCSIHNLPIELESTPFTKMSG